MGLAALLVGQGQEAGAAALAQAHAQALQVAQAG